jgi:hypothetical protein
MTRRPPADARTPPAQHLPQQAARRNRSARFMIPLAVPGFPGQDVRSPVLRRCATWRGRVVDRFPAVSTSAGHSAHADTAWGASAQPRTSHGIADHEWRCWPLHKNVMPELPHIGRSGRPRYTEQPALRSPGGDHGQAANRPDLPITRCLALGEPRQPDKAVSDTQVRPTGQVGANVPRH